MRRPLARLMLSSMALAISSSPALAAGKGDPDTVIHAGRLIDGVSQQPRAHVTIRIHDGRIVAVEDGFSAPKGATVIDLSNETVMPGMIDCHVHITGGGSRDRLHTSPERVAIQSSWNMRNILMHGVTAVRDVSGDINVLKALQESIEAGLTPGPHLWYSGMSLTPTGGPADFSKGQDPAWTRSDGWLDNVIDSPNEAVHAVRDRKQKGASVIKINSSGGVASSGIDVSKQVLAQDELDAIVRTAHSLKMKVATHAHGEPGIHAALLAGVDSIEHGTFANEGDYKLMKDRGVYLVPTLYAAHEIHEVAEKNPDTLAPDVREKALRVTPLMMGNLTRAYHYGVRIAMGTDQLGYHPLGDDAREFAWMVEAGMTPMDAIIAGTSHGADLIGHPELGAIQPDKAADIIAMPDDPLKDITALQRVSFVMKGGVVVKTGGKPVIKD